MAAVRGPGCLEAQQTDGIGDGADYEHQAASALASFVRCAAMVAGSRPLLLAALAIAAVCAILGSQAVIKLRTMATEMQELRSALVTTAAQRDAALQRLQSQGDIPMEETLKQQAACPPVPPPPPPPPPCASTGAAVQGAPPAPAPVQKTAGVQGKDWRVPPGPIPPRPEKMPRWFKFQQPEQWCIPGPHNKVHSNRVAAIVVNYNMVERADNIAEGIKKYVKWPVDVIVVDNGSDLKDSPPSKHTAIRCVTFSLLSVVIAAAAAAAAAASC